MDTASIDVALASFYQEKHINEGHEKWAASEIWDAFVDLCYFKQRSPRTLRMSSSVSHSNLELLLPHSRGR